MPTQPTSIRSQSVEASERYVKLMGGEDKVVAAAKEAVAKGEHRWAAELLKHVVYVSPKNKEAKSLLAETFDHLGFASESSAWRNFYLTGSMELREGPPEKGMPGENLIDMLNQTPIERYLEAMAASLNASKAEGKNLKINLVFSDTKQSYVLRIENSVLHHAQKAPEKDANATLTLTQPFFLKNGFGSSGWQRFVVVGSNQNRREHHRFGFVFSACWTRRPVIFPL